MPWTMAFHLRKSTFANCSNAISALCIGRRSFPISASWTTQLRIRLTRFSTYLFDDLSLLLKRIRIAKLALDPYRSLLR